MTTYYKIIRPVEQKDLNTSPGIVEILKMIPSKGYVTFEHFKSAGYNRTKTGVRYARKHGILQKISPYDSVLGLDSVNFWLTQLNESGHRNSTSKHDTKKIYLHGLSKLNAWLLGRSFPSYETVWNDGQITRKAVTKSFANVEELMNYCNESDYGVKTAQRVVREYMAGDQMTKMSSSTQTYTRSAIKSYFGIHDVLLVLPKMRKKRLDPVSDDDFNMTLEDFYRMVQDGKPSVMMKTIMLIKLQSGMDSSTLTDCFNYEEYPQLVKYFKTDDHKSWNLDMCPVPISLVRVKTNVQYTTFLERDAIAQLQRYLTWKEAKYGKQDISKPLFMTKQNTPIHSTWLSTSFSEVAVRAGIQEKVSHKVYKIRAHRVRHVLKSTLITYGCAQYAAEHVLGHAPRDAYEKQAVLYPENLRAEYAKASPYINIFSKVESNLNTADDPANLLARIKELEDAARASRQSKTETNMAEDTHTDVIKNMQKKLDSVLAILDALPDGIKKPLADKFKDSENRG